MARISLNRRVRAIALGVLAASLVIGEVSSVPLVGSSSPSVAGAAVVKTPGSIISATPIFVDGVNGTSYSVKYWSQWFPSNKKTDATGLIFVPNVPAPPGGYPVVSWAHPTRGLADQCAPSRNPSANDIPSLNTLLNQGWLVVASDYLGLASKKTHPYLVGESEARGVIDIVRAARNLPAANASPRYVVWGWSQGGHATLFAEHIAQSYAPELDLEGTVTIAGPSQFAVPLDASGENLNYVMMAAVGIESAYGPRVASARSLFTKLGRRKAAGLKRRSCGPGLVTSQDLIPGATASGPWPALVAAQDPGTFSTASSAPMLLEFGGADTTVRIATGNALTAHLCGLGQVLERWTYPLLDHGLGRNAGAVNDAIQWIAGRFAGEPAPGTYVPTGSPDVEVTNCP